MTDTELNEKLNNDFKAFRMEHDNRIAQKYVEQIPGKGLSEENFTPQEKNKLASLTGGADIDTSQFATKDELQTALSNVTVDTSALATKEELQTALGNVTVDTSALATKDELQTALGNVTVDTSALATKDELQTALSNVTVDTSALATKTELQTATRNVAHHPLNAFDVYISSSDYNTIMKKFNVASQSEDVRLTRFLKILVLKLTTGADDLTTKYTAEDIYNAALNISQSSLALIDDDLYVPQEDLANYIEDVSNLENELLNMQLSISENFITTAAFTMDSDILYTDKVLTIKMADVFLEYLKTKNIVPTTMYFTDSSVTYKVTDDNLMWFNVIANGSFEKLTANNLANATELYACCDKLSDIMSGSDYYSDDIWVRDINGNVIFAVV